MNKITSINNHEEHQLALARIEEIIGAQEGPELEELDQLAEIIHAYESIHFPIEAPTQQYMLQLQMDRLNLTPVDLEPQIGSAAEVQAVLSGELSLTETMIKKLDADHGIPAGLFTPEA
jgi:HTH-type transcriptional regulator/antitoxin HigA